MNRILDRLGRFSAGHPWRALVLWATVLAAVSGSPPPSAGRPRRTGTSPAPPPSRASTCCASTCPRPATPAPRSSSTTARRPGARPGTLTALDERLAGLTHVAQPSTLRASPRTATPSCSPSRYDVPVTHRDLMGTLEPLEEAVAPTRDAGLQVALGGELPGTAAAPRAGAPAS